MLIRLETTSGIPIYRQVMDQLKMQVATERLKVGERIPSVRQLALSLAVNPLTIAKAYTELEREGVIETQRGVGTFVARDEPRLKMNERIRQVRQAAEALAAESVRLDVPPEKVEGLLREALERYSRGAVHER